MKNLNIFEKLGQIHMQLLDYSKNWFREIFSFFFPRFSKDFLAPKSENNLLCIV